VISQKLGKKEKKEKRKKKSPFRLPDFAFFFQFCDVDEVRVSSIRIFSQI
jgi:hypothetical protein